MTSDFDIEVRNTRRLFTAVNLFGSFLRNLPRKVSFVSGGVFYSFLFLAQGTIPLNRLRRALRRQELLGGFLVIKYLLIIINQQPRFFQVVIFDCLRYVA